MVAILCMLIVSATNGMTNSGITVFDEAMLNEFGWSVGQLKVRDSINFFGAAVLVVFVGHIVDRYGFKPPLLLGLLTLSITYFAYSFIQSLVHVYALHVLFAVVVACSGNMVSLIAAASTMPNRRGLAVGITVAGTSVGGVILPPLANWLAETVGWRAAMRSEALIPLAIFFLVLLLLRNRTKAGQTDAEIEKQQKHAEQNEGPAEAQIDGVSFKRALNSRPFWLMALAAGFTFYSVVAIYAHLFLYMRGLEFDSKTAALGLSALSLAALIGKLAIGWLSDHTSPYLLLRGNMLIMLLGLIGVFYFADFIWLFLAITGLAWGGLHTLYNFVLLALFGMRSAGKINASISVAQSAGAGTGAAATGLLFDQRSDYSLAFGVVIILMISGLLLTLAVKPLKPNS